MYYSKSLIKTLNSTTFGDPAEQWSKFYTQMEFLWEKCILSMEIPWSFHVFSQRDIKIPWSISHGSHRVFMENFMFFPMEFHRV